MHRHIALGVGEGHGVRLVGGLRRLLDQFKEPLGAGKSILQLRHNARDLVEGLGILIGVAQEAGEPADGDSAFDGEESARKTHGGVNNAVDEAGRWVGYRGEEYRLERALGVAVVYLVEFLEGLCLPRERLDDLLRAYFFFNECGLLASGLGLRPEHRIGAAGDKSCDKERERREQHDDKSYLHVYREHEAYRAEDGYNARKKLGEAHEQAVGELVGVGDDAADRFARGVAVDIAQGQYLYAPNCGVADIAHHAECYLVVERVHYPLRQRRNGGKNSYADEQGLQRGEINISFVDDIVYRPARKHGDIERRGNAHGGEDYREREVRFISADIVKHLFESTFFGLYPAHALASSGSNCERCISR